MLWRTSFSSGSSALKTLTFPVFSSVEPPPEPPPPPLLSSPLSALHAPATRTSTAVNAISDQRRIAPLLSFLRLFHPSRSSTVKPASRASGPRRRLRLHGQGAAVPPDDVAEPPGARLRRPFLGREVDVDEPEPLAVALGPLEVVQEGPREEPLDRGAGVERATDLAEVAVEVGDPLEVLDDA